MMTDLGSIHETNNILRISRGSAIQPATSWEKIVALGECAGEDDDVRQVEI